MPSYAGGQCRNSKHHASWRADNLDMNSATPRLALSGLCKQKRAGLGSHGMVAGVTGDSSAACKEIEVMALSRLDWVARTHGFLEDQQMSFRWRRCTADSIADMVSTLEGAKAGGDLVMLLLINVHCAFDSLPHAGVQHGLDVLGICGNVWEFLASFLQNRILRLAWARLPASLPIDPHFAVQSSIYADGIALWLRGPPQHIRKTRAALQRALDTAAAYLCSIVLTISARMTEALLLHPRAAAHCSAARLRLEGVQIPWSKAVTYLGQRIDNRLTRLPATNSLCAQTLRVRKAISQLLARGQGCTTSWALQLSESAATSRLLCALPLVALHPPHLRKLELQNRSTIRVCLGVPEPHKWPPLLLRQLPGPCHYSSCNRGYDPLIVYTMPQVVKHS
ncbi:uncharacterized protein [Dermacentor andersoni]|uniref:uncharacterized protein n=1 Tax=Dermacentor andersoni TaxID=34620 RepID=UPI003B39FC14